MYAIKPTNRFKKRLNSQKPKNYIDLSTNDFESFDIREKWPECKDVFEDIYVQGNCSSSWAISVATSIQSRRCIQNGKFGPQISAWDFVSCASENNG